MPQNKTFYSIAITFGINIFLAGAMTLIAPRLGSFWHNFVYSNCIGWPILIFMMVGRRVIWAERVPSSWGLALWGIISGGVSWFIGMYVAATLLHHRPFWMLKAEAEFISPGLVLTAIGALGGTLLFWARERVAKLQLSVETEARKTLATQNQLVSAQLSTMQAQLEPHMLFNTLANLRALISQDPAAAQSMLDTLISFLRKTLAANQKNSMALADEFTLLEEYLQLMKIRIGERLKYTLKLDEDCHKVSVPTLLLQPLVENAIKHGIETAISGGEVSVTALRTATNRIEIKVRNPLPTEASNNTAFAAHNSTSGQSEGGYGLQHVQARLQHFYAGAAQYSAQTSSGEFVITLTLPA